MNNNYFLSLGALSRESINLPDDSPLDLLKDVSDSLVALIDNPDAVSLGQEIDGWLDAFCDADGCLPDDITRLERALAMAKFWEVLDDLDEYCPPYTAISVNNGGYVGVAVDVELIASEVTTGDLPDYNTVPVDYAGFAVDINERGNITLYDIEPSGLARAVWSVV